MIDFEIARTLADAARRGASGLLTATRSKLRRLICLRDGRLVHVASNVLEEQLEALLVKRGLLEAAGLGNLRKEAAAAATKPGMLLLRANRVAPQTLYDLALERTRELLHSTLDWQDGEFAFALGRPQLEGELTVDLPLLPLLYEHAQRRPIEIVRGHLTPTDARSIRTEHAALLQRQLGLEGPAQGLLEMCDGFLSNADVLSRVGDARGVASRALYALHVVGALRIAGKDEIPRGEVVEPVTREELLARLVYLDESDHYAILGLNPQAPSEQMREAYYYLARRYHPDRYRAGELQDLLPRIEAFFTRVTEAYNILADPAQRRQYDDDIALRSGPKAAEPQQDKAYLARQNYARGKLLVERKQLHEAVRFFENAIELDPVKPEYYLELGRLLARNPRRRDEAERLLVTAVERNPSLLEGYRALAELLAKAGRTEEAARRWEELLRWDPQDADALAALGSSRPKGRLGG